ncbi:MAG: hypothetical protein Ct9H90mP4_10780 [Gammaproteobacteria bacterium]|nr:MAG: hypothetical protein Ct9H90mP4_10780 [Gammaproteobacteria bacterium]
MTKNEEKEVKKPGTALQEINLSSPGANLESYINSIHGIGILLLKKRKNLQKIFIIETM